MKIIFICGSLEAGNDGVGDYTRRLAAEVIRQGHEASAISLYEKNIHFPLTENQYDGEVGLPVLRIPYGVIKEVRLNLAKKYIIAFEPEWLSLQFVPYSFNKKGICIGLGKQLKSLGDNYKWHIMFHELWIGKGIDTNFKHWIVSKLQKWAIKSIGNSLLPTVIHTHLPVFYDKLKSLNWSIYQLPLFSNIPVINHIKTEKNDRFTAGFFSQVEINEPITAFIHTLALQAQSNDLDFQVILIGGNEGRMKVFGDYLEALNFNIAVKYTGFLEAEELALVLQSCDIGITPIPRHALGKSGSVAAFVNYGIPVGAPCVHFLYDARNIGFFSDGLRHSIITEPGLSQWKLAKEAASKAKIEIQLSLIAKTFLSDLSVK